MQADEELARLVTQAIQRDERLSSQQIEISVNEGVVTLIGSVQSYHRKIAAAEVASSFEGCCDIINDLTVEPPDHLTDEKIADNVRAALCSQADTIEGTIVVSVASGVVRLNGNAKSYWEHVAAEDIARFARGAKEVENFLLVTLPADMANKRLGQDIEAALSQSYGVKARRIDVAMSEGAVVLSGKVPSLAEREMAERVARLFRLRQVRNELTVIAQ
jgi:osmotically-inducible protein OsmY